MARIKGLCLKFLFAVLLSAATASCQEAPSGKSQGEVFSASPDAQLQIAMELVGQVDEELWQITDSLVPLLLGGGAREQVLGGNSSPGLQGEGATQAPHRRLQATTTQSLDSVVSQMKAVSQKLLLMELQGALTSMADSTKRSFNIPTGAPTQATNRAVDATGDAAAALLLGSVQGALGNPAGGTFPLLSGAWGGANRAGSKSTDPITAALTSGTQMFAKALNTLPMLPMPSGTGTATAASLLTSDPVAKFLNSVGQLDSSAAASTSNTAAAGATAAATAPQGLFASLLQGIPTGPSSSTTSSSSSSTVGTAAASAGSFLSQLAKSFPTFAATVPGTSTTSTTSSSTAGTPTPLDFLSQLQGLRAGSAALPGAGLLSGLQGVSPATITAAVQSLLAPANMQGVASSWDQQMGSMMDTISQHSADFGALLGSVDITSLLQAADLAAPGGGTTPARRRLLDSSTDVASRYLTLKEHWEQMAQPLLLSSRRALQSLPAAERQHLGRMLGDALSATLPGGPLSDAESDPLEALKRTAMEQALAGAAPGESLPKIDEYPVLGEAVADRQPGDVQLILIQSIDAMALGQQMVDGLLGLLHDTIHLAVSAAQQHAPIVAEPRLVYAHLKPRSYPNPNPERVVEPFPPLGSSLSAGLAGPTAGEDAVWDGLFSPEVGEVWSAAGVAEQEVSFDDELAGWQYLYMRRRLQAREEGAITADMEDDILDDYSYDDEYAEERWLDEYAWMLEGEEAVQGEYVAPLVVGLMASWASPSGLPQHLLEWLAQVATPTGTPPGVEALLAEALSESIAAEQLQYIVAATPGSASAALSSTAASATAPGLPHFAIFGPKQGHVSGSNDSSNATTDAGASSSGMSRIAELVVVPLSGAARAPASHHGDSKAASFSAKWWGLTISLAFIGMLLGAVAVTVMRRSSSSRLDRDDSYNHMPGVPGPAPAQHSPAPSAWEAAMQKKGVLPAPGPVAKKLSNLPA